MLLLAVKAPACCERPGENIDQETPQPHFGAFTAEQQHDPLVADDFLAHDLVEAVGEIVPVGARSPPAWTGVCADFCVLEHDRIAGVPARKRSRPRP